MAAHRLYRRFKANESRERSIDCIGIMCYRDRCPFWMERSPFTVRGLCVAGIVRELGLGPEILLDRFAYYIAVESLGVPRNKWEEE